MNSMSELENTPPVSFNVDDQEKMSYYCIASNIFLYIDQAVAIESERYLKIFLQL